jgi:hypothetical protein
MRPHNREEKQIPRCARDDIDCHPEERSDEGSAFWRRSYARWAVVLAVLGIAVGFVLQCNQPDDANVSRQAAAEIVDAEHARTAATTAIDAAKAVAHTAERESEVVVSRASAARVRARVVSANDVMVSATPNAAPLEVRVPAPVIERMQLDSSAVAALGTLVRWKDTVIVKQDRRITADSIELVATSNAFHTLQRAKEPRCGRKCGIVLGVAGMLAAAVAVEQVRRTIR